MTLRHVIPCLVWLLAGCTTATPEPAPCNQWSFDVFRGTLTSGPERCSLRACGVSEDWWLEGDAALALCSRGFQFGSATSLHAVRVQGELSCAGHYGHLSHYPHKVTATKVEVLPAGEVGCP